MTNNMTTLHVTKPHKEIAGNTLEIFLTVSGFNSFRNTVSVSNSLDPDQARHFAGLICVQTVCKCYQQTILVSKELK